MLMFIFGARHPLAWLLTLVLSGAVLTDSGFARTPAGDASRIRSQVSQLHLGTIVEVRFINQEKVRARLASSDAEGFTLQAQDPAASERRVSFAEVKSLKAVQSRRSKVATWIVAGALIGVVVVALAVYLTYRHNE
jgi:hypothetical protein